MIHTLLLRKKLCPLPISQALQRFFHATTTTTTTTNSSSVVSTSSSSPPPPQSSDPFCSDFHAEIAVIGAGVIGLAIARALALRGKEVVLIERNYHIAQETSSRNSQVIHAGIYYRNDSLKAKFCVQGKQLLYRYCQDRNISHSNCGKLIVATHRSQVKSDLCRLQQQAHTNGVTDVQLISKHDVQLLEPSIKCEGALYSPSSGIVDSHTFFLHLLGEAEDHGAMLAVNTEVVSAMYQQREQKKLWLQTQEIQTQPNNNHSNNNSHNKNDTLDSSSTTSWMSCDMVVNAAGLWADQIARMIHSKHDNNNNNRMGGWQPPRQYFAKGTYFSLTKKRPDFRHLVYPVPEPGGLGIHATIDLAGQVKFGPDVEWIDTNIVNVDDIEYTPNPDKAEQFYHAIRQYWPELDDMTVLQADYVGIRPKLSHPSVTKQLGFDDFLIAGPNTHGIPGLVHLLGIESPGLTSSLAIAEHVVELLLQSDG
ncbi:FAD dependent oxidoreductase [Nitzschia inconspicua]|uniref:L-2-hydroxyglutarate dehydrogenase, mitochondrial n=1 Tax=Nitzschia inconspicua TaxID=303405 RepID=A0A9K3LE38_9STRA|nr:FAD dependent oxidoreductase [Nitzschia inconspicua]